MGLDSSSMLEDLPGMDEMLGPGPSTTNWLEQTEDKRVKMEWNGMVWDFVTLLLTVLKVKNLRVIVYFGILHLIVRNWN